MGPAGKGRSESKTLIDTSIQELHPRESFLIDQIFSAQKHCVNFSLKTFVVCWVQQEVVPQVRECCGGSAGTAIISISLSRGLVLKGIERDITYPAIIPLSPSAASCGLVRRITPFPSSLVFEIVSAALPSSKMDLTRWNMRSRDIDPLSIRRFTATLAIFKAGSPSPTKSTNWSSHMVAHGMCETMPDTLIDTFRL